MDPREQMFMERHDPESPRPREHVWRIDTSCLRSFSVTGRDANHAFDRGTRRCHGGEVVQRVRVERYR